MGVAKIHHGAMNYPVAFPPRAKANGVATLSYYFHAQSIKAVQTTLKSLKLEPATKSSNILEFKTDKVQVSAQSKTTPIEELYKAWILELTHSDRLTEVLCYSDWRETHGQSALESQYKAFVTQCLDNQLYSDIKAFEDWLVVNF